ncbi:MAG: hypothetical protein BHV76_00500 [Phocaeicola plebeius]|uniref:Fimbrillin family protein n=1 Tax=Phocaeicola plebeius TaxID=310297 RepID=A0A854C4H0_9BACT|nr:MAG: hypothetical protein BHV76_00500 [Phocaeicola plebeius]
MKTRFFALAALALALAACNNDNENLNDDSVAAVINAEISDAVSTRASGTAWAERDEIGISESRFGYTNVPYRWESGKFTPTGTIIFFQDDDPTTFSAYYPYDADGGTLTATTDATAQQNQPAMDFLYATGATASTHNPEVNFTDDTDAGGKDCSFHHCMSQITLTFKAGSGVDFNTIKPTGYTLSGLVLEGSFDTTTGTAETDDSRPYNGTGRRTHLVGHPLPAVNDKYRTERELQQPALHRHAHHSRRRTEGRQQLHLHRHRPQHGERRQCERRPLSISFLKD